jgi:putative inorganic carbon (HCO3(-)) transporter
MSLRDLLVLTMVMVGALIAIRRPWVGVMLWTWLSIMNPHRYAWGIAYDAPVAAIAAASTLLGLLMTRERDSPFKGAAVVSFALFSIWLSISWALGLDPAGDYEQWNKVIKVNLMIVVALALLRTKEHILALAWVCTLSLGLLGLKGGLFTLVEGGNFRVWGPPGSFIEDNNEFGLAMVMTIPLLRFLQLQLQGFWPRQMLTALMLACAASAIGTHSRGSLLAILAMSMLLWWRGKSRLLGGLLMIVAGLALVAFMPEHWSDRMASITEYEQDSSAIGRLSAWWTAWGIGWHYPFGVGFNAARPELFAAYSPYAVIQGAHSIYFQILGNHGFIGLFLFFGIWIATWRSAAWLRKNTHTIPQAKWCSELGAMSQVSLLGYAVGGAFLSLSYFDLPYNIMVMVVLSRVWVQTRAWERELQQTRGWRVVPGLAWSNKGG